MSAASEGSRRATVRDVVARTGRGEKLVVVSAYDALFARLAEQRNVDLVLVGDSPGKVVAGHDSTLPVTLEHMIYRAPAVRRGLARTLLIVDMPLLRHQVSVEDALRDCGRVVRETGAQRTCVRMSRRRVAKDAVSQSCRSGARCTRGTGRWSRRRGDRPASW